MIGVVQRVRGVGVDHQRHVAEPRADALHRGEIPAGLDLDLDALIAGRQLARDFLLELIERVLDADGNAGRDPRARAAEQPCERLI